ncbi:uncharacterized protein EDB91DRAFT_1337695 [Suillus paluster]|uniref:uncharacterized protein n=1 Tax=Suillus paluster TaxID=48578 RepID=UPI001B86C90C|nr:uncharacterized protein EDB91DRAFT_1337695 [Suillus paluster]KAG1735350.1 hypothetical protein EDB91DRAFT_1337695 [Suillus paluster]
MCLGGQDEHEKMPENVWTVGIGTVNPSGVGTVNFSTRSCSCQNFAENRTLCTRVGSARSDWKFDCPQAILSSSQTRLDLPRPPPDAPPPLLATLSRRCVIEAATRDCSLLECTERTATPRNLPIAADLIRNVKVIVTVAICLKIPPCALSSSYFESNRSSPASFHVSTPSTSSHQRMTFK